MFSTRLNPTKPPAAHRAILERVGAACRELRPIDEACFAEQRPDDQIAAIFAKHGVLKVGIDVEFGGVGAEPLLCVMAAERIGREGSGPLSFFVCHTALVAAAIRRWGTPEQRGTYLPAAARGECVLGFAGHEPHTPGDAHAESAATVFRETASGFLLSGQNRLAVNAERGGAVLTFARDSATGSETAFLIDTPTTGMHVSPSSLQARLPSGALHDVVFENCPVSPDRVLGERGRGSHVAVTAWLGARLGLAGGAVGLMADCVEIMAAHAAKRIASSEASESRAEIERHIAKTAADLEAARALVYAAAELKVEYDSRPMSEHLQIETDTLISEAKYFAGESLRRMMSRAESLAIGGQRLLDCLPARHRLVARPTVLYDEAAETLEQRIAAYYLFL